MTKGNDNSHDAGVLRRLASFLWDCKWWWIVPAVVMGLMFGFLVFSQDITGDAPFIYTLF